MDINIEIDDGYTLLAAAASTGKENVVNFLLERKANVNTKVDVGLIALFLAAG